MITTNAIPPPEGICSNSASSALRPPADAPMPTIGNPAIVVGPEDDPSAGVGPAEEPETLSFMKLARAAAEASSGVGRLRLDPRRTTFHNALDQNPASGRIPRRSADKA